MFKLRKDLHFIILVKICLMSQTLRGMPYQAYEEKRFMILKVKVYKNNEGLLKVLFHELLNI
jgi:hypothetical protein